MTKFDIGWLAGIIDAEGCIRAAQNPASVRGFVQINMNHVPTLKKAQVIVRELTGRKHKLIPDRTNRSYRLCVQSKHKISQLLRPLVPFLTAKRAQAELLLDVLPRNDASGILKLQQMKRNPEPSRIAEGVETVPGELQDEDIGWLAGVIDGDGSFLYRGRNCGFMLGNTSLWLLDKARILIAQITGELRPILEGARPKPHHNQPYYIHTGKRLVLDKLVSVLYEHLVEKRDAALAVTLKPRRPKRQSATV